MAPVPGNSKYYWYVVRVTKNVLGRRKGEYKSGITKGGAIGRPGRRCKGPLVRTRRR